MSIQRKCVCAVGFFFPPAGDDVMTDGARAGEQTGAMRGGKVRRARLH